ncbi:Serine/threonine-protein phosphatase 2A 55 kDa regulatory subunit B [Heracleum sosnowskyi]|uniref:Serine/threonine-protein phosphatase 2A 55 kDa regulatory subunit B n=1 Tax=Heracleum sosnowskyi TaxID=360622 RepID=A0AAD8H8G4_9APIA|nr:Serine/threonine-protein phosphatase 2A 55 kDa regulatory subunit B [Heracleum sosnowskyi]
MASPSASLHWNFSQVFGERNPADDVQPMDVISAIDFEDSGDHLAVGDQGGRLIIFEKTPGKDVTNGYFSRKELEQSDLNDTQHPQYQYKTEIQSHEPEFDYLKSVEIEEKINDLKWCARPNQSLFVLSTNHKTIKLWKVKECKLKKVKVMDPDPLVSSENALLAGKSYIGAQNISSFSNGNFLESGEKMDSSRTRLNVGHNRVANLEDDATARCRKVYAHAHDYNINSISNNSDGETFVSADDLRINLWNLEVSNQCFNIVDLKPPNMDDLTEVITSAEFHPLHCNTLAYSSSRGFIRLVDLRQSALCDHSAKILHDDVSKGQKTFFTEIITSISDMKFAMDGRHLLSRDFMTLKLWDIRMETSPVATYKVHEHLRPKLSDLYNNDAIFDKFDCCISGDGRHFATGSYSNLIKMYTCGLGGEKGTMLEASRNPNSKAQYQAAPRARRSSLGSLTRAIYRHAHETSDSKSNEFPGNLNSKLLHMAWHPRTNMIACATGNSVYMYYA